MNKQFIDLQEILSRGIDRLSCPYPTTVLEFFLEGKWGGISVSDRLQRER